ncbi:MAG TPA: hypothetical protein PKN75_01750 [Bacteroidia bacterium]|nr:hypothetical protein [Bacteroidia bacterium]HNU32298.1 hypothetical protein [Bacteroidia bacterium]
MTGLDILLTIMSVVCFGIAFLIASKPIAKAKEKPRSWSVKNSGHDSNIEIFSSVGEETQ